MGLQPFTDRKHAEKTNTYLKRCFFYGKGKVTQRMQPRVHQAELTATKNRFQRNRPTLTNVQHVPDCVFQNCYILPISPCLSGIYSDYPCLTIICWVCLEQMTNNISSQIFPSREIILEELHLKNHT